MFESEQPPADLQSFPRAVRLADRPPAPSAGAVREADICASLKDAAVSLSNVPGGVVIELRPTERAPWPSLQAGTDKLESALAPRGRLVTAIGLGRGCDVPDVAAHRPLVRVERFQNAIRVHLTTRSSNDIDRLRSAVRDFAEEIAYTPAQEPPL